MAISLNMPRAGRGLSALVLGLATFGGQFSLSACGGHSAGPAQPGTSGGDTSAAGATSNGTSGVSAGANTGGVSSTAGAGSGGNANGSSPGAMAGSGATGGGGATTGGGPAACPTLPTAPIPANHIIQFNDSGAWNWFQDERAVVDTVANKFVIGSVASGGERNGDVEAVIYDIATGTKTLSTLGTGLRSTIDDHNAPAFLVRPDGKYFAMWSGE